MKNTSKILALVLVVMTLIMSLSAITVNAESTSTNVYTLNANDLDVTTASADNTRIPAGTNNYFTVILKNGGKIKEATNVFEDESSFSKVINFGGKINWSSGVVNKSAIEFTTANKGKVKVWWIADKADAYLTLQNLDKPKTDIAKTEAATVAGTLYITEFEISGAGTWYVAPAGNNGSICKVVVTEIPDCTHTGGTATCMEQAVCTNCGESYGELSTDHNYVDGACSVCGTPDPDVCQHTNKTPATCTAPETCECGETFGEALGHIEVADAAVEPTCTEKGKGAGSHCDRCGDTLVAQEEVAALGHTLTFVTTVPTADAAGKTIADCSVCKEHFDFGEVNVLGAGLHVLDANDISGLISNPYDGQVVVVNGKFALHLSEKSAVDTSEKDFDSHDWWSSTHRYKLGAESALLTNGEEGSQVKNGGYKSYVQFTITGPATIKVCWVSNGDGRQVGIYDMDGKLVTASDGESVKNGVYYSELTLDAAGTYLLGTECTKEGDAGSINLYRIEVDVEAPVVEDPTDDPTEEPTDDPTDDPTDEPVEELGFFARIWAAILGFLKTLAFFKKLFGLFGLVL